MKTDPLLLSQADQLETLAHYYELSRVEILDWGIQVLWEQHVQHDLGLLTLLEMRQISPPKDL